MSKNNLKCHCSKLLARYDKQYIYLYCKLCKKEIAIKLQDLEPKSRVKK